MTDQPDDIARRASNARFQRRREEIVEGLGALLGPRSGAEPVADADRAAALAAESLASRREAEPHPWALVRRAWGRDAREELVTLLHAFAARLGTRPTWLVLPGREPQAVTLTSDQVLDNPMGFAALAGFELVLIDRTVPAGLWLMRQTRPAAGAPVVTWELEIWGEPWLSAGTRTFRELPEARG